MISYSRKLNRLFSLVTCLITFMTSQVGHTEEWTNTISSNDSEYSSLHSQTSTKRAERELTSREIRRESLLQTSFHTPLVSVSTQLGVDLDYLLNAQTTIGISSDQRMTATIDGYEIITKNFSLHLKRFIGNSFYVKPSMGVHLLKPSKLDKDNTRQSRLGVQVEVGNEWFLSEHFGIALSYGAIGVMYDEDTGELLETSLIPSIRLFGAF